MARHQRLGARVKIVDEHDRLVSKGLDGENRVQTGDIAMAQTRPLRQVLVTVLRMISTPWMQIVFKNFLI